MTFLLNIRKIFVDPVSFNPGAYNILKISNIPLGLNNTKVKIVLFDIKQRIGIPVNN
jgi:hypothetical protein